MADTKNYLIVLHGIGEHTKETVTADVEGVLSKISPTFKKNVETHVIAYNKVFQDWIKDSKADWNTGINSLSSTNHFSGAKKLLKKLVKEDPENFLETHVLDVALYLSTVGIRVQLEVALQLTDLLDSFIAGGNTRNRRIVLLGHSLGTAVTHDSLHKMILGGFEDDRANRLANMPVRINSLYQVANTSRLLKTTIDPTSTETAVRPAPGGIIDRMYNVHHKFDPIPHAKPFKVDPAHWIPETPHPKSMFFDIELKAVYQKDVHAITHYLNDPRLYVPLLFELDKDHQLSKSFRELKADYDKASKKLIERKLQAKVDKVKKKLAESVTEIIQAFLEAQEKIS